MAEKCVDGNARVFSCKERGTVYIIPLIQFIYVVYLSHRGVALPDTLNYSSWPQKKVNIGG
jgi:hypothetical protein